MMRWLLFSRWSPLVMLLASACAWWLSGVRPASADEWREVLLLYWLLAICHLLARSFAKNVHLHGVVHGTLCLLTYVTITTGVILDAAGSNLSHGLGRFAEFAWSILVPSTLLGLGLSALRAGRRWLDAKLPPKPQLTVR